MTLEAPIQMVIWAWNEASKYIDCYWPSYFTSASSVQSYHSFHTKLLASNTAVHCGDYTSKASCARLCSFTRDYSFENDDRGTGPGNSAGSKSRFHPSQQPAGSVSMAEFYRPPRVSQRGGESIPYGAAALYNSGKTSLRMHYHLLLDHPESNTLVVQDSGCSTAEQSGRRE